MVVLFGQQIRASSNRLQTKYVQVNGSKVDLVNTSDEKLRKVMDMMLKNELTAEELGITE